MEQLPSTPREADLSLSAITRQEALQVRELQQFGKLQVRPDIVEDYRQLYEQDRDLGLLNVVEEADDGEPAGRYLLADGYHRSEARFRLAQQYPDDPRWATVRCLVYTGDAFTALLLAIQKNSSHGLHFGLADRKKAAEKLLRALGKRGVTWSDVKVAQLSGLSRGTIAKVREDLNSRFTLPTAREVHRNGQVYPMTPAPRNQPYVLDPLLDTMPDADLYIEPPTRAQSTTHGRSYARQPRATSAQYHAPKPVSMKPSQGQLQFDTSPPRDNGHNLWDQSLSAGAVPAADGVVFRIEWQRIRTGVVQAQGVVNQTTPPSGLSAELRATLEELLRRT